MQLYSTLSEKVLTQNGLSSKGLVKHNHCLTILLKKAGQEQEDRNESDELNEANAFGTNIPVIALPGSLYRLCTCEKTMRHFRIGISNIQSTQGDLERIENIGEIKAKSIKCFKDFSKAEKEIKFIEKYGIKPLFLTDDDYPQRLLNCFDPPTMLFYKGQRQILMLQE